VKEIAEGEIDTFFYPDEIIGYEKIDQARREDKEPAKDDKERVNQM